MATASGGIGEPGCQAQAIERALMGLSLPVRVDGAAVQGEWIRYHVFPVRGTAVEQVRRAAPAVAERIGVAEVRVAPAGRALALEVRVARDRGPRLLSILSALGPVPAWTAVVGVGEAGAPLLVPLPSPATDSIVVSGDPQSGKSELIRTLAVSLVLTTSPGEMQLFGIDMAGRELGILESLPHLAADLATTPRQAGDLLRRLSSLPVGDLAGPARLLVVDDDGWLDHADRDQRGWLRALAVRGPSAGVHLLAASRHARPVWLSQRPGVVVAQALHSPTLSCSPVAARFLLRCSRESARVRAAYLSASDLDRAARLAQAGWVCGEAAPKDPDAFGSGVEEGWPV